MPALDASRQLGDGTTTNRATPQAVPGLSGGTAVATGGAHTCVVLSDSTVRCWGDGMEGQLGGGGGAVGQHTTPTSVVGLSGVAQLAAGSEYTCALLTSGGASCWGSNYDGQLGNASV